MSKAADRAYDYIRAKIVSGTFAAGSHLKEEQIAEDAGVSRTPVREALHRLSSEHLVRFIAHRGAYVAHWTGGDVDDIFQLRSLLESYAASRAASRITSEQVAMLAAFADQIERLSAERSEENHVKIMEYNQRFHSLIIEAAQSERLDNMLSMLVEIPMMLRTIEKYDDRDLERSNHHHREIIAACRAQDAEWARSVMESHLHAARHIYLSSLGEDTPAVAHAV